MRALVLLASTILILAACSKPDPAADQAAASTPPATTQPAAAPAAPAGPFSTASLEALDRYAEAARTHAAAIEAGEAVETLSAQGDELVKIAASVLPDFLTVRPDCREYLEKALALHEIWTTLSAEDIEAGYHKDGALPKIEDAAACYHMKDLIVHPITAQALLAEDAEGNRAQARLEIDEVVAHVAVVKATR